MNARYGWVPDRPDFRDRVAAPHPAHLTLPAKVDMRALCPPVYDQGQLGSCTANAIAAAMQFERHRQGIPDDFPPSRLFIYYNERAMEGSVASDSGAAIRDGIKSVAKLGDCPEYQWPYDTAKFADKPADICYANALKFRALDYWRVPRNLTQMRGCLAAGFPFVIGFSVYESFETDAVAKDGMVPMPKEGDSLMGGHAVLVVGYDDNMPVDHSGHVGRFIVRNSWGPDWADGGYFYLPYAFLTDPNLSDDFWTIKVEAG